MVKIELACEECGENFLRERGEHNRNTKLGRRVFCSMSCAGKVMQENLGPRAARGNPKSLIPGNRRDEYSPFRAYLKMIRARHKRYDFSKTDITLPFLKQLWESQDGVCPFTGWKMHLPETTNAYQTSKLNPRTASLDRLTPGQPYMKKNVRFVTYMANVCRHTFSDEDVQLFAEAVVINKKEINAKVS